MITCPVICPAASDASQATVAAWSPPLASFAAGIISRYALIPAPRAAALWRNIAESVMPGQTQFTVMPCGAISTARQRAKWDGGGLGRTIGDLPGAHDLAGDGGDDDDASAAPRNHAPDGGLRTEEGSLDVYVELAVPGLLGEVGRWRGVEDSGVADEQPQRSEFGLDALDHRRDVRRSGHVPGEGQRNSASSAQLRGRLFGHGGVQVVHADRQTLRAQGSRDLKPDAASRASHYRAARGHARSLAAPLTCSSETNAPPSAG